MQISPTAKTSTLVIKRFPGAAEEMLAAIDHGAAEIKKGEPPVQIILDGKKIGSIWYMTTLKEKSSEFQIPGWTSQSSCKRHEILVPLFHYADPVL
jgi:hypothetical protein